MHTEDTDTGKVGLAAQDIHLSIYCIEGFNRFQK